MTSDEFRDSLKNDPVVIIPLGATEAHGPHLPLLADTIQPVFIANAVDGSLDNILVAPPLNYALHSSTKNLPGTINLTFDTLRAVIYDILTSLHDQGIRRFVVISGHGGGGHMTALSEGCKRMVRETDAKVLLFADCDIGERAPEMKDIKGDGHGGLAETSRVLAIRPDLVRSQRPIGKYASKGSLVLRDASITFPDGFVGDTTRATPELGKMINDYIIAQTIEMIKNDLS